MAGSAPQPPYWSPPPPAGESTVLRFLRRPPGWVLTAGALLAAAGLCWSSSSFGTAFGTGLLALGGGAVVVACWLFRTVASAVTARRFFLRSLVVPLVVGATVASIGVDAPTRLRFAQARPGFEHAASEVAGGADPRRFTGRIGTYRVDLVARRGRGVYFYLPGGFLGSCGVAYLPDGPAPPEPGGDRMSTTPLQGPWYRFSTTWD